MIQMLPLLPPDWGTWKWDEGNLSATTEQTQQSYQTLIEKGLCANFSRFVWNDIVDLTANALEAAGIAWDSRYGSVESCKITEQMGTFMANMFNGVATNINRLGLFRWKWEVNYKDKSYLGRPYVNGASTHGERADSIYAMYILELVKRLNWFLSVLKDEANFKEQISTSESQLTIHPKLASLVTAPSRSYEKTLSSSLARGRTLPVAPHKSILHSRNLNDAELLARVVAAAHAESLIGSSIDAVSRAIHTLSVCVALMLCSKPYATLSNISPITLIHNQQSTTSVLAIMEAGLRELVYRIGALSYPVAQFTDAPASILYATPIIETLSPTVLTSANAPSIFFIEQARSLAPAVLEGLESNCLSRDLFSTSYTDTEIGIKRIGALRVSPFMETAQYGEISAAIASSVRFDGMSTLNIIAQQQVSVAKGVRYADEAIAHYIEEFRSGRAASFNIEQFSNMDIDATMDAKQVAIGVSTIRIGGHYAQVPLVSGMSVSNTSKVSATSCVDVALEDGIPYPLGAINESDLYDIAFVNTARPEIIACVDNSISLVKADAQIKSSEKTRSVVTSESDLIGEMSFAKGMKCEFIKIECNSYAVLENGAVPEEDPWYDHVQTGSNLYIRQTYEDPRQTGTDLNISEIFFDPVIEGSNLHIISAASLGGDIDV